MVFQEDAFFFSLNLFPFTIFFSKTIVTALYSLLVHIVHVGVYIDQEPRGVSLVGIHTNFHAYVIIAYTL